MKIGLQNGGCCRQVVVNSVNCIGKQKINFLFFCNDAGGNSTKEAKS